MSANTFYDSHGNKSNSIDLIPELGGSIPDDVDISGYINSFMFMYASPKLAFLGNSPHLFIAAPNFTTTILDVGLGELTSGKTNYRFSLFRCFSPLLCSISYTFTFFVIIKIE